MITLLAIILLHIFSLHVRRFHDLGISGWGALSFIVPLLNLIVFLFLFIKEGEQVSNKYGEVPVKGTKFFDAIFNRSYHAVSR